MGSQIFLLLIGASLVFWPGLFVPLRGDGRRRRLAGVQSGEPGAFFEERRSLEAYPPKNNLVWRRVLGGVMIVAALALFILDYRAENAAEAERAALSDAREAVSVSREAVSRVTTQDPRSYQAAQAALDRADVALAKSERLSSR